MVGTSVTAQLLAEVHQNPAVLEMEGREQAGVHVGAARITELLDRLCDKEIFHQPRQRSRTGTLSDGGAGGGFNLNWDGVWQVRTSISDIGWSAEFAIPWRTLRYPDASVGEPWGINVMRVIRRKNEIALWQSWEREGGGLQRVSRAGHLTGLTDLPRQGLNMEVKPYGLAARRQEVDDAGAVSTSMDPSVGVDLKSEVLPGLLLELVPR